MITFLTSSFVKFQPMEDYVPNPVDESNQFVVNLRKYWKENTNFLIFSSDPYDDKMSKHLTREMQDAFSLSNFSIAEIRCFDNQYIENYCLHHCCDMKSAPKEALKEALEWADVFFLAGGHAPTENTFMKKCDLKGLLKDQNVFDGIFIGLSAGTANAAEEVYLMPELPGESIDPEFIRFTDGLGLTRINVVPHIEYEKTVTLDGKKLIDEIVAKDSTDRDIYLIPDGSYFIIHNGITQYFGEGMIMRNGVTRPLYSGIIKTDNVHFKNICPSIFDTNVSEYYDCVLELDVNSGNVEFFHISNFFLENGIIPVNLDSFDEFNCIFSDNLIVAEEKKPFLDQLQIPCILNELETKGSYVRTVHLETPNGIKAENIRVKEIDCDPKRLLVTLTDITMILDHDWMTDEYSRSGFLSRAEKLMKDPEYQNGYSVVYANVQGFKAVNDLLGTQSGDMVIFLEKDALVNELNPIIIARLESDHFVLITKTENITAEKMNRLCYQSYTEGTKKLPILIRCGIYNITDTIKKVPQMLDQAKLAEKSIPAHGTPYAVCSERMIQDHVNQRVFVSELDNALKNGEFLPYYQPIVDAKTGEIVSAEALIRWNHHEKGMIPPGMFIPAFEKEGQTTKLDSFMVNSVLNFNIARMQKGQKVVPCAVNLSRMDFYDTKLMAMLKQKLKNQTNVQEMLKLEITESAYAVLETDALTFLDEMKKLGLTFLLDDFGSGMSSLSTLEVYNFDVIKLDMGFIRKIGKNPNAEAIIRHTIGMAHDMGAKVVAEGVETKEQLEFLQEVDCDMIQGYYFYKPMPEEEFAKLL